MMKTALYHLSSIDSTNSLAKRCATRWNKEILTLISADEQTGGRGRFDRKWLSPKGKNIYASYILFTQPHHPHLLNVTFAGALATVDAISACDVQEVSLKWPNDVLIRGKKVGGILVETTPVEDALCVVVGIGLNVLSQPEDWQALERPVTSILAETGKQWPPIMVLRQLTASLVAYLSQTLAQGFSPIAKEYRKLLCHKQGDFLQIGNLVGTFWGISDQGALLLKLADGTLKEVFSGEVVLLHK